MAGKDASLHRQQERYSKKGQSENDNDSSSDEVDESDAVLTESDSDKYLVEKIFFLCIVFE